MGKHNFLEFTIVEKSKLPDYCLKYNKHTNKEYKRFFQKRDDGTYKVYYGDYEDLVVIWNGEYKFYQKIQGTWPREYKDYTPAKLTIRTCEPCLIKDEEGPVKKYSYSSETGKVSLLGPPTPLVAQRLHQTFM